jgi:hypothetical protein
LLYDNKGRFTLHHISAEEAKVYGCGTAWMGDGCVDGGWMHGWDDCLDFWCSGLRIKRC